MATLNKPEAATQGSHKTSPWLFARFHSSGAKFNQMDYCKTIALKFRLGRSLKTD